MCDLHRKEGDHEFMNIVSNEIGDEVLSCILPIYWIYEKLYFCRKNVSVIKAAI